MNDFLADLRRILRSLRHRPGSTVGVVLTLAVGIGTVTTFFSALESVWFRALPYRAADRLVFLWSGDPARGTGGMVSSLPDFRDWQRQARSFTAMAAFNLASEILNEGGMPEEVWGAAVSPEFFAVLGVTPALGRDFSPAEGDAGSILLSRGLWQRRFGGDPAIAGRKVLLSGRPYTIIGVLPAGFRHPEPFFLREAELFRLLSPAELARPRGDRAFRVLARLRPGVALAAAQAEMAGIARRLSEAYPDTDAERQIFAVPVRQQLYGDLRFLLGVLLALAAAVLGIAAADVVHLRLAQALARQRDTAVQLALGASWRRLLRQTLLEGAVLTLAAWGLGLAGAAVATRLLAASGPASLPGLGLAALDGQVIAASFAAAVALGLAIALVPAWAARRTEARALGAGSRPGGSPLRQRIGRALAGLELALTLPLVVGAFLLATSAWRVARIDPGFRAEGALSFGLSLPPERYADAAALGAFYGEATRRLAALPGVRAVGWTSSLPLSGFNDRIRGVSLERRAAAPVALVHFRQLDGDAFAALGLARQAGRLFGTAERPDDRGAAVINRALARLLWPGQDPLGRALYWTASEAPPLTVVGVVGDAREVSLTEEGSPCLYAPARFAPWRRMSGVVRTAGDPAALAPAVRRVLRDLDPQLPVADLAPLARLVAHAEAAPRFHAGVAGALAALAVALAALGVFSIFACTAAERRRDLALTLALGARKRHAALAFLRQAAAAVLPGLAAGAALALWGGRALASLLFETPVGPAPVLVAAAALLLLALAASALPLRRALGVDPASVLRQE